MTKHPGATPPAARTAGPARSIDAAKAIVHEFAIDGELVAVEPHERGHIHNTFISTWRRGGASTRCLHQQMNDHVFTDIPAVMQNVECVTRHLDRKARAAPGAAGLHTLRLVPTRQAASYLTTAASGPWRTYEYIEDTESFDLCRDQEQAYEAARAFGRFQAQLIDLDVGRLRETLPSFFSSPFRLRQLRSAVARDQGGRARRAAPEIEFAESRAAMVHVIDDRMRSGQMPVRVVHGDTKLNNVLFDRRTGKAVCIVDLDTCMSAWSLYDFGDLVRFTAARSSEDETDLGCVGTDLALYRALVDGYLEDARGFLTAAEIELMPFAARLVTLTIGLRFLTDFLAGDVYFKVARPEHNLDRARVQFEMVRSMERQERDMAVR